jgi:hypothetical protein
MDPKKSKSTKNILNEQLPVYGFVHRSEMEKLKENVFRSDKEKQCCLPG